MKLGHVLLVPLLGREPQRMNALDQYFPRIRLRLEQVHEVLAQNGVLRFTRIGELVGGISQRMLTKTLRQLEEDGLVTRTVYPEVPPRVEYQLTELGHSLCAAFCGVWLWAEKHYAQLRSLSDQATSA